MKSKKQNGTTKIGAVKIEAVKQEPEAVVTKKNNKRQSTEVSQKAQPKIKKEEPVSSSFAKSKKRKNRKRLAAAAAATPTSLVTPKKVEKEGEGEGEGKEAASIAYLKLWQEDRKKWKFQKIRQIWLNENMLNSVTLTNDVFPIWLEYMAGSSKRQKQFVVKKATEALEELEGEDSTVNANDVKYQRAKKIIQSLDVEVNVKEDSSS